MFRTSGSARDNYQRMQEPVENIELPSINRNSVRNEGQASLSNRTTILALENNSARRMMPHYGSEVSVKKALGLAAIACVGSYGFGIATMAAVNRATAEGDGTASKNVMDALDVRLKQLHAQASSDYLAADKTNILCDKPDILLNLAQTCSSFDGTQDDDFSRIFSPPEYWNKRLNCSQLGVDPSAAPKKDGAIQLVKRAAYEDVFCANNPGGVLGPECKSQISVNIYESAVPVLEKCAKNPNLALTSATGMRDRLSLLAERDPKIKELDNAFTNSRIGKTVTGSNTQA